MSLNGKRDDFTMADFKSLATTAGLKNGRYKTIAKEVRDAVSRRPTFAEQSGVINSYRDQILSGHRLTI